MKTNEKVVDYSSSLLTITFELRSFGEKLQGIEMVSNLLRLVPKEYYSIILPLGQLGHLKTMKIEEAIGHLKCIK